MRSPVEIRYAGVAIGRAETVQPLGSDSDSYFVPLQDPMPVGTELELDAGGDRLAARVVKVIEADTGGAGMEVRVAGNVRVTSPKEIEVTEAASRAPVASGESNGVPDSVTPEMSGAGSGPTENSGGEAIIDPGDAAGRRRRKRRR